RPETNYNSWVDVVRAEVVRNPYLGEFSFDPSIQCIACYAHVPRIFSSLFGTHLCRHYPILGSHEFAQKLFQLCATLRARIGSLVTENQKLQAMDIRACH